MKQAKDYIVFPLDVPSTQMAKNYVKILSESVGMFKVGLELFIRSGPEITHFIRDSGPAKVFLDLKLHDIPTTVLRAVEGVVDLGVAFATVHCGETSRMLEAAVTGSKGKVGILGVTVLTSISSEDLFAAGFKKALSDDMPKLVRKKAVMAKAAGCAGVVCSGLEVEMIKKDLGQDFIVVTPGIRPVWDDRGDDQRRVTTPTQAIQSGSDYIVIGRPIRDAQDPKVAAVRIAEEIETVI
ncbi:MAG: orotidine-5'-phosphate decarboxylase [Desulfobacterales bacterium]|nr:MAG: orotidine-5'-phosphate decarboxylase [Desulfobacterales bacterium]